MDKYEKGYDANEVKQEIDKIIGYENPVSYNDKMKVLTELLKKVKASHTGENDSGTLYINRIYETMRTDSTIELAQATIELVKESRSTSKSAKSTAIATWILTLATWALVGVTIYLYYFKNKLPL